MKVLRSDVEAKIRDVASTHGTRCTPERAYALSRSEWTSLEFNRSGRQILACTKGGYALNIDEYKGSTLFAMLAEEGGANSSVPSSSSSSSSSSMSACFAADDKTLLCGNENGTVSCVDAETGAPQRMLRGHVDRVEAVVVNPRYAQITMACTNTALWIW